MIEIIARLCTEIDKRLRRHAVGVTQNLSANPGRLPSTIQSSPEHSLIIMLFLPGHILEMRKSESATASIIAITYFIISRIFARDIFASISGQYFFTRPSI